MFTAENLDIIRNIVQVCGILFIPVLAWILKNVNDHSKQILILEERVNKSISDKLNVLEVKMNKTSEKLEDIEKSTGVLSTKIELFGSKIDQLLRYLDKREDSHKC